ncbi:MAG: hypothetical protein E7572_08970 [Ruminococcaceae bacterium]|nr:hypothetical protein [Oscillospiraceae bacterium]
MSEELTVEELVKTLRCCAKGSCDKCPLDSIGCMDSLFGKAADTLEKLQAENARLAKELDAERHR